MAVIEQNGGNNATPSIPVVSSTNFHVDGNNGNDILGNGSTINPFKTLQWAAHRARIYSFTTNLPVTIIVFGSTYTIEDTQIINGVSVVGNLNIFGGWFFYAGSIVNHYTVTSSAVFSGNYPVGQRVGNLVVRGALEFFSNGSFAEHRTILGVNYSMDFEWKSSTTLNEFLIIHKTGGAEYVGVTLKNGSAVVTGFTTSVIKTIDRPVIFAVNCGFSLPGLSSYSTINFNNGADSIGIYATFDGCGFGSNNTLGQVEINHRINILDITSCKFYGRIDQGARDNIVINMEQLSYGYLRLYKNFVQKRGNNENGTVAILNNFVKANANARIIAIDNDLQAAQISAAVGVTLTTMCLDNTLYPDARNVTGATFPAILATNTDNVWTPAYNFWR